MRMWKRGLLLIALASLPGALPTGAHAGAYLTGKVDDGTGWLENPKVAVWDVKCKAKAPICASVWDQAPNFQYYETFHVSTTCISPVAQKGKGQMQFYLGERDGGSFSPDACTPACTEALVTVQCDLLGYPNGHQCGDTFAVNVDCNGGAFASGFPKKIQ